MALAFCVECFGQSQVSNAVSRVPSLADFHSGDRKKENSAARTDKGQISTFSTMPLATIELIVPQCAIWQDLTAT
jgi:hypothetical protein